MTAEDRVLRRAALTRLAIAMRERLPEGKEDREAFFKVYLDDLERFSADTFVKACRRLETTTNWFPKKPELYDACQAIVRHREAQRKPTYQLAAGDRPVDQAMLKQFMAEVKAAIARNDRRMK